MQRRMWLCLVPVILANLTHAAASPPTPQQALEDVAHIVTDSFPAVEHLPPQALIDLLAAQPHSVIVLDVRTPDEFAISRIDGAIRIDPSARNTAAIIAAAGPLEGKIIVAYCSIGLRSARLLMRIEQSLKDRGALKLYNLRGGVFQWRNEQRPLTTGTGPTQRIHPYSAGWRQYLALDP